MSRRSWTDEEIEFLNINKNVLTEVRVLNTEDHRKADEERRRRDAERLRGK